MDPWTLAATAAVVAATAATGAVFARTLVRAALAPGGLSVPTGCVLVVGALALGGVLSPLVGGLVARLAAPLSDGLAAAPRGGGGGGGAVVAIAGASGPVLAWALWSAAGWLAARSRGRGAGAVAAARRPGWLVAPGLVSSLAAAVGALVALGAPVPWSAVLGRVVLASVAGPVAAAVAAAAVVVLVAWGLRHATPEPVHRRARALAPLTVVLLGVGAGLQVVAVARLLAGLATQRAPALGLAVQPGPARWLDLVLAGAAALGAAAWLARGLRRESPVRRATPLQSAASDAGGAGVLVAAALLGAVVPVRATVSATESGAAAVAGARVTSARLVRLVWSAAALVPVAGVAGLALGAVLGRLA